MTSTLAHGTGLSPYQPDAPRLRKAPIMHQRYMRPLNCGAVTSSMGGKMVPLTAKGLLREDGMRTSRFAINVQMAQTAQMLINPVRITAHAVFVPKLALDRFKDMGTIDRSYNGIQEIDGSVVPWFETGAYTQPPPGQTPDPGIYKTLGLHCPDGGTINLDYVQAYNQVWNHLATLTSPALEHRTENDTTLAPAFWSNTNFKHVKPNFDDALLEGEVPLTVTDGQLPLKSISYGNNGGGSAAYPSRAGIATPPPQDADDFYNWGTEMYSQLAADGITVSLANIKMARETASWARLRTQFQGYSEEWMMDQLLAGVRVVDEQLRQPIILDTTETIVGMSQRFATDAANLDQSMTDGRTQLVLEAGLPAITTGGVFMIVAQALPEMMYERQRDHYLRATTVADLPNRTADELDVQPVELVKNGEVDESHTLPDDLFGYRPLNGKWVERVTNIGGKYYRPDPAAIWNENRNRIWSPDVVDPTLGPDMYLSETLSHEVFVSTTEDPFEWWLSGIAQVDGLTYFGPALREGTDDYDKVLAQVPKDRVKGDGTDVPAAAAAE